LPGYNERIRLNVLNGEFKDYGKRAECHGGKLKEELSPKLRRFFTTKFACTKPLVVAEPRPNLLLVTSASQRVFWNIKRLRIDWQTHYGYGNKNRL